MYQVTFVDGSEFTGGEPESSMWDMLPNKPIKSVVYWLREELKYSFTDFEEYGHIVERVQVMKPGQRPIDMITKAIIMGRVGKRVYQVIFDLKENTVYQLVTAWGEEYSNQVKQDGNGNFAGWENGKPVGGWLHGIIEENGYPGPKLKRIEK